MCCGNCGNKPCGNFTYIRYASDKNGSDFSKTRNAGAIERCFQAIITSPIALDEETISFQNLFNGLWNDICASCACGCEFFAFNTPDYITQNGENTWTYNTSTAPTYSLDPAVANKLYIVKMSDGDSMIIPNFRDGDDQPLVSGVEYCFEFNLVRVPSIWPDESLTLSLGNGPGATQIVIDSTTPLGYQKVKMTAQDGSIANAYQLFLQIAKTAGGTINGTFEIKDFRFAPSECCDEGGLNTCNIIMEQKDAFTLGPVVNFVATDFGTEVDIINAGVVEITRGDTQGLYNSATETGWNNPSQSPVVSPEGTLWNSIYTDPILYGFGDLSNVANRQFAPWYEAVNFQAGVELPALEMVMLDVASGKFYKVEYVSWSVGGESGGGFEWNRQEIILNELCYIQFSDGSKQNTAARKIVLGDGLTGTESVLADGTIQLLIESSGGDLNTWDIPATAFVSPDGNDLTGVVGDGNKPFQSWQAAMTAANNVIVKPGTYFGTITLQSNKRIYCLPGAILGSGSRLTDGRGQVQGLEICGWLEFSTNSYGVEVLGTLSSFIIECRKFNRTRSIAFMLGSNSYCKITAREGFDCNCNNGGGYASSVRGGSRLELHAPTGYHYTDHWGMATGAGGGSFVLRCPDVRILNGGVYGNVGKSLINVQGSSTGSGSTIDVEVDFLGGTMRMEHASQASSFGVRDSALLIFVNAVNNATHRMRFSNGTVNAGVGLGLLIEYIVIEGYVELDNIKISSLSKPVEMSQRATASAGYCQFVAKNCELEGGLDCEFGNGRIARLFNTTVKVLSGVSIFTFNNANATSPGQLYLVNCNTQLDGGGGETFTGFATATIGSLNHHSSEVIGVGAVDTYGGFNQVATLELPNIKI